MTKTRLQALEELYDKAIAVIVDSEIQIEYFKKKDPKMIVFSKVEMIAGQPFKKDFTAEILIKKEEEKLKENNAVLDIISGKIQRETSTYKSSTPEKPIFRGEDSTTPSEL